MKSVKQWDDGEPVADDDALHNGQGSIWQLLFQSVPGGGAGSERRSVEQVTHALVGLGLHPVDVDQIEKIVLEAMQKTRQGEELDQAAQSVLVRLWCSGLSTADTTASSDVRRDGLQGHRGWGFFLLERQESAAQDPQADSHRVIEVYVYQERRVTKKRGSRGGRLGPPEE